MVTFVTWSNDREEEWSELVHRTKKNEKRKWEWTSSRRWLFFFFKPQIATSDIFVFVAFLIVASKSNFSLSIWRNLCKNLEIVLKFFRDQSSCRVLDYKSKIKDGKHQKDQLYFFVFAPDLVRNNLIEKKSDRKLVYRTKVKKRRYA